MPDTSFVQAVSVASPSGLGVTTFNVSISGTTAGNNLFCTFMLDCVAPSGAAVTMTDNQGNTWHPSGTQSVHGLNGFYTQNAIPGGNVTATIHVTGAGATITAIAAAIMEYANADPFNTASEFGQGNNIVDVPSGGGLSATVDGENVLWQALTNYDVFGVTGPIQVQDTGPAPAHLQLANNQGTSGATPPVWDHAGGTTNDGTMQWSDQGVIPTGALLTLWIGFAPFAVFPAVFGAGWQFRTQAANAVGIAVYDQVGPWIQNNTATVNKQIDTYDLITEMQTFAGNFTAPPATPTGIFGSFVAEGGAGTIIGGNK